jgi:hypothetical protein
LSNQLRPAGRSYSMNRFARSRNFTVWDLSKTQKVLSLCANHEHRARILPDVNAGVSGAENIDDVRKRPAKAPATPRCH